MMEIDLAVTDRGRSAATGLEASVAAAGLQAAAMERSRWGMASVL